MNISYLGITTPNSGVQLKVFGCVRRGGYDLELLVFCLNAGTQLPGTNIPSATIAKAATVQLVHVPRSFENTNSQVTHDGPFYGATQTDVDEGGLKQDRLINAFEWLEGGAKKKKEGKGNRTSVVVKKCPRTKIFQRGV